MSIKIIGALSVLIHDDKILLIKRNKPPYTGLWALPGGKVEDDEHITDTAIREIKEETGIKTDFLKLSGFLSELLFEKGKVLHNFLLYICTLKPHHNNHIEGSEGELKWFDLEEIDMIKDTIIPSDLLIIKHLIINKEGTYFECDMEKHGDDYKIKRFEMIN